MAACCYRLLTRTYDIHLTTGHSHWTYDIHLTTGCSHWPHILDIACRGSTGRKQHARRTDDLLHHPNLIPRIMLAAARCKCTHDLPRAPSAGGMSALIACPSRLPVRLGLLAIVLPRCRLAYCLPAGFTDFRRAWLPPTSRPAASRASRACRRRARRAPRRRGLRSTAGQWGRWGDDRTAR